MNRYAFNVFLEKQKNNQQVEEGILGKAATVARRAMKDSETVKTVKGVGAVVGRAKEVALGPGARKAFSTGYQRGIKQGQGVRGSVKRGLSGALETGVRSVVKDPRTAKKVVGLGRKATDFVKSGGLSKSFVQGHKSRGSGSDITYGPLGVFGGDAAAIAARAGGQSDPLAGLSPAERRKARLAGAAGPVTS